MRGFYCFILAIFSSLQVTGQDWSEAELNERLPFALKLGTGISSVYGGELKNPRPLFGFNAGLAWHGKKEMRDLNWQTGLEVRFRGSNFANQDSGNSAYTRIGLITLDIPLLINFKIGEGKPENVTVVQAGLQASYIFKSIIYVGADKTPAQRENYLKAWDALPLFPIDAQLVFGFQNRGPSVGYQLHFLMGIGNLNRNKNFKLPDNTPVTGTGKPINTWSVELALLF